MNLHESSCLQAMSAAACFMISGECTPITHSFSCTSISFIRMDCFCSCFLALASVEPTRDFCEQLDKLVGPQLTLLASDICEQFTINRRLSGSVEFLTLPFVIAFNLLETFEPHC